MNTALFVASFVALFVAADPIGTSAVFSVLTKSMPRRAEIIVAVKAVGTALLIYAFFGYFGMKLLQIMGISLAAFKLAGGMLLFVTAFRMIMGRHDDADLASNDSVYADRQTISVFPLAIPLLSGPGCLTAFLMMLHQSDGTSDTLTVVAALLCVQAIAFSAFMMAGTLKRFVGPGLMAMIARVMGILLASMAVQFVADASKTIF